MPRISMPAPVSRASYLELRDGCDGSAAGARTLVQIGGGRSLPASASFWDGSLQYENSAIGFITQRAVAPAAASTYKTGAAQYAPFPLARDWSQVPERARRFRRFTFDAVIWREDTTTSDRLFIGLCDSKWLEDAQAYNGVQLASYSGGPSPYNWHLRYRSSATPGAPVTTQDLALDPTTPRQVRFQFLEGLSPRLTVAVDGVTVLTLEGAELPVYRAGASWLPSFGMYATTGGDAAQAMLGRYVVEDV